ncbi:TonB-dependent receptor [Parasphingopyxis lamellibrachiae]|uniref:Outer membrane receptor protein involved in Fe transport n=1 Tax=Parasphingopyxis lamellibrachiae TaxID=680125 RepID=A0A3D9FH99_9SPHN|nr:TonB-dependent receptor [Parasphingopyxis lamellibrachiae]RED17165.1 outer membrane receptor protein involved in Fe transport [Parasphingopyxis lamellibrachiae]
MRRSILLATAGIAAIASPAMAQNAETAAVSDSSDDNVIVVIAQGREQRLQDVPIAVSAVNAESLQNSGANDIRQLNQLAPSLLVSSTGNEANGSARIRGIGTVGDNPGLESSVAVFIDGVYRSRSGAGLNELGPIERVEVLRGPQGTLFGRNASAGLINIVTAGPSFDLEGYAAATYGNFDTIRLEGGINFPIGSTVAARVDGVYLERDGFYNDRINGGSVNDQDRYLLRAQALWEATPELSIRIIGDYSNKDEECCAAVFVTPEMTPGATQNAALNPFAGPGGGGSLVGLQNPIIPILLALGQDPRAFTDDPYDRNIYPTAGRSYAGETEDWGVSLQANWELGAVDLTSITAYRDYSNNQGSDTDYTGVDILFRAPGNDAGSRQFQTFSQELRLQGTAFNDTLDWLIGAYYAHEDLTVTDNLKFGSQYGAFAPCRVILAINPALVSPGGQGCLSAGGRAVLAGTAPGTMPAFGAGTPLILGGLDLLSQVNNVGANGTRYEQTSENFAFFTHNIIHITDRLDLTLGARYTNENKDFSANFNNTNAICPVQRNLQSPLLAGPLAGLAGALISLSCQGNSSTELNALNISDDRSEEEFTGTAVLSYRPTDDLLLYASYSRGYKAGGFNLDRSALTGAFYSPADTTGQSNISVVVGPAVLNNPANLQFDEETVDAFEIGAKYTGRNFSISAAAFRQEFSNFQLNTFNGTVFLVQNINSCGTGLNGADQDTGGLTGACAPGDVQPGVISQGIEVEATLNPTDYLAFNAGFTYADTGYENDLIGRDDGTPLDPALRLLPGDSLSNAPDIVVTGAMSWTPPIGSNGMSGLVYLNTRMTSGYNTGSDLLFGKEQEGYVVVNARVGLRGADNRWSLELWAQNLFDTDYTQVAFNTPFIAPQQTYSAFLAEPRTYGVTVRTRF